MFERVAPVNTRTLQALYTRRKYLRCMSRTQTNSSGTMATRCSTPGFNSNPQVANLKHRLSSQSILSWTSTAALLRILRVTTALAQSTAAHPRIPHVRRLLPASHIPLSVHNASLRVALYLGLASVVLFHLSRPVLSVLKDTRTGMPPTMLSLYTRRVPSQRSLRSSSTLGTRT